MESRHICIGCKKTAPDTETDYTLIGPKFRWRVRRFLSPEGTTVVEWRCPACWRAYKAERERGPRKS